MSDDGLTFQAIVNKVQTLAGGGLRVTLDVPESELEACLKLAKLREQLIQIGVVPIGE